MSCYKTGDNKHLQCPPRMDDGRHFTDFRTNSHINNLIRTNNAIMNSHNYRTFLTQNANKLMNINRAYASEKNGCGPCNDKRVDTMLPEQTIQVCNNQSCKVDLVNNQGIGMGRRYNTIEQQCNHPADAPPNQPSSCCAETNDQFNYHNQLDSLIQNNLNPNRKVNKNPEAFNL